MLLLAAAGCSRLQQAATGCCWQQFSLTPSLYRNSHEPHEKTAVMRKLLSATSCRAITSNDTLGSQYLSR